MIPTWAGSPCTSRGWATTGGARLAFEPPDAEAVDRGVGRAGGDQLGHHRSRAGTQLETVGGKAELVEHALRRGTRPDHRDVIRHARLDAGPGSHDGRRAHRREELPYRAGTGREFGPVDHRAVLVAIGHREMAAADHHGAVVE